MKQELIKDNMSSPVISISSHAGLYEAHKMMVDNKVRRLPVLEGGKLAGIISLSDILEAKPSPATSLSVWELNYIIPNLRVQDYMSKDIQKISQNASITEAANIMLEKKVGGIPVTDDKGELVGIITESDIFRLVSREWTT